MHFLVTAGPTRERIDPVRFISNRSTGKMGYAVARAAARAGHRVTLVSGPVSLEKPDGVESLIRVESALEMLAAVQAALETADALVMTAAVADFRPANPASRKMHKSEMARTIELVPNPDILATLSPRKGNRIFAGFAAETGDPLKSAAEKLSRKGLDLIVANDVTAPGAGFAVDTNIVTFLRPDKEPEALPLLSKDEVAERIVAEVERLVSRSKNT